MRDEKKYEKNGVILVASVSKNSNHEYTDERMDKIQCSSRKVLETIKKLYESRRKSI